jgi:hypothetical protein
MLSAGYANRDRDGWTVHGGAVKICNKQIKYRKRILCVKFAQLKGFTFLKQTGNKDRDFHNQISGDAGSS